jgi:hypothetical protein
VGFSLSEVKQRRDPFRVKTAKGRTHGSPEATPVFAVLRICRVRPPVLAYSVSGRNRPILPCREISNEGSLRETTFASFREDFKSMCVLRFIQSRSKIYKKEWESAVPKFEKIVCHFEPLKFPFKEGDSFFSQNFNFHSEILLTLARTFPPLRGTRDVTYAKSRSPDMGFLDFPVAFGYIFMWFFSGRMTPCNLLLQSEASNENEFSKY